MPGADLSRPAGGAFLGVDVGGTFTDAVLIAGGSLCRAKVPTTRNQSTGVLDAAGKVLANAGLGGAAVTSFAHGMTTATNALLERKGARTVSITTNGFRDLMEIGRQKRPRLYDLCPRRPEPLVPPGLRLTARERVSVGGEITPLSLEEAERVVNEAGRLQPQAVAVCLLFSFLDPSHERRLKELIEERLPGAHVSLSSEVLPQFREYERFSTTAIDAYLTPVVDRYLESLGQRAAAAALPEPFIMQSSGGVLPLGEAARSAAPLMLSGPAAGVVAAVFSGIRSGARDLIAFDMGGTSTDVTLIRDGAAGTATGTEVGGFPVALPMVDIHTIGAGGGSIAWIDAGGALRVGPESAGAEPGPACYGRGGKEATVTDANLCLGYLGGSLGDSGLKLDAGGAGAALEKISGQLGLGVEAAAQGIRSVANAGMIRALRVISVERGHDPGQFVLIAFGGAGPMHAADLAAELGMRKVMVPDSCGILSALGLVVGGQRRDWVLTVYAAGGWDEQYLKDAFSRIEAQAAGALREGALRKGARLSRRADLRYRGQAHELTVDVGMPLDRSRVIEAFEREHERAYGYRATGEAVELVNVRLTASIECELPDMAVPPREKREPVTRPAYFGGEWIRTAVWQRPSLGPERVAGPAVIEEGEATTVVPPGWEAYLDETGNLWLEAVRGQARSAAGTGEMAGA